MARQPRLKPHQLRLQRQNTPEAAEGNPLIGAIEPRLLSKVRITTYMDRLSRDDHERRDRFILYASPELSDDKAQALGDIVREIFKNHGIEIEYRTFEKGPHVGSNIPESESGKDFSHLKFQMLTNNPDPRYIGEALTDITLAAQFHREALASRSAGENAPSRVRGILDESAKGWSTSCDQGGGWEIGNS